MVIREFVEEDRSALQHIYLLSRRESFTWLDLASSTLADFDRHTPGEKIWLCESQAEIVAFISVDVTENYIHHLFVLPEHIGEGYGSALLTECLKHIGRPAMLKCLARNTRALKFYERSGWRTIAMGTDPLDRDYHLMECGHESGPRD